MSPITLYGIKNCDSVKKARRWLDDRAIDYRFHDVRIDGLDRSQVQAWLAELGLALVNKRSTSWKTLEPQTREQLDEDNALDLLMAHPTLIKRPLLDTGERRHLGFDAKHYQALLGH